MKKPTHTIWLVQNQNWAKLTPWMGIIAAVLLFRYTNPNQPLFWALINIPLYLFHQAEEHYWPGGFKHFINQVIDGLPSGEEKLTDLSIFWVNILLVWVAFVMFGALAITVNIGFGLLIIIFSIMNCLTHIFQGIKRRAWNPGLVMASLQFVLSLYGAYFVTKYALTMPIAWWAGAIIFSVGVHACLFKMVMKY